MRIIDNNPELKTLLDLNRFIFKYSATNDYHMEHIVTVGKYAMLLNKRLNANLNNRKLMYIALTHDLFKEQALDKNRTDVMWNEHEIHQDNTRYVRTNLDVLEELKVVDYFNTDVQYHALSAAIFLKKEFGINDPEILYPVMFHSCPIIPVYQELPFRTQTMVDVVMLSDKLSSNYVRINSCGKEVKVDLDQVVFGSSGRELNYSLGLYLARLISQGKSKEEQSVISTRYYLNRLVRENPLVPMYGCVRKLGGSRLWPKRKSQALMML